MEGGVRDSGLQQSGTRAYSHSHSTNEQANDLKTAADSNGFKLLGDGLDILKKTGRNVTKIFNFSMLIKFDRGEIRLRA